MPEPKWKGVERRVARYLGGERNPLSGGSSRHTRGDALIPYPVYAEVKDGKAALVLYRSRKRLLRLFKDTVEKALAEGKVPIVVLHPNGWGGGVGTYPTYLELEVSRPSAMIGEENRPALLLDRGTVIQVPLSEVKKVLGKMERV